MTSARHDPARALCIERRRRARDGRVANARAPRAIVTRGASPKTFSRGATAKGGRARRPRAIDRCYLESRETERESYDTGKIFPVDGRARATRPSKTAETRAFVFPAAQASPSALHGSDSWVTTRSLRSYLSSQSESEIFHSFCPLARRKLRRDCCDEVGCYSSVASRGGFGSREQVGCWRSLANYSNGLGFAGNARTMARYPDGGDGASPKSS